MTFDELLKTLPEKVLKRPLSDDERSELLEISSVLDMQTVSEYLYLILTFKLFEDKLSAKINTLGTVEETMTSALKDGAAKALSEMSGNIADESLRAVGAMKEYQQFRGQMIIVTAMTLTMVIGYVFGAMNDIAPIVREDSFLYTLLALPIGWMLIFCSAAYGLVWSYDNWKMVLKTAKGKFILAAQILVLLGLLLLMF